MEEGLKSLLERKLLTISGSTITVGSLCLAVLVLIVTLLAASLLSRGARRVLRSRHAAMGAQYSIGTIVRYAIYLLGAMIAFNALGVRLTALLAASAVVAVGIGFGLQNIAQNFICGLILLVDESVRQGDYIQVGTSVGTVVDIGLRATRIRTRDDTLIIVPNSALITTEVVNQSRPTTHLRIPVPVSIAYGSDVERVTQQLIAVARAHGAVLPEPIPEVFLDDFGDAALRFTLLCWIDRPSEQRRIQSELRLAIAKAFAGRTAAPEVPSKPLYPFGAS